jgi:hypothetical protein
MTDAPKTESHPVGTLITIKAKSDVEVTFPSGFSAPFSAFNGEVHVVLHERGTFVIDGKTVQAV